MSGTQNDLSLGRPAGGGTVAIGADERARRETRLIYIGLAVTAVVAIVIVYLLTHSATARNAGVASDTRYDFALEDPHAVIRNVNRIDLLADVYVKSTVHADKPDTFDIQQSTPTLGSNGSFRWTITPQLGTNGPSQITGSLYYEGALHRICDGIIGEPPNFPPEYNRNYAEVYYTQDNTGARYRTPVTVDKTPFVNFIRLVLADTANYPGDGSLPSKRIREAAGDLIQNCIAR